MMNIYSIIAMVAFILSGLLFVTAIIIFFILNVRGTYVELKEQTDKDWYTKKTRQKKKKQKAVKQTPADETDTTKHDVDDEAVTTLDSGEIATEIGLVGVYEPGTDFVETERTEIETVKEDVSNEVEDECATDVADNSINPSFVITKKVVKIHSDEIIF